ncbi:AAA family ATPase, partial [Achromobacter sp. SIMBA_011]
DIAALVYATLEELAAQHGRAAHCELTDDALRMLCAYPWPGNVRQLENTCRWITVMASGREVHISDLPPELLSLPQDSAPVTNW